MKRRKRKPIQDKTRKQRVQCFVNKIKYLRDSKYYKNNYVVVAHWDSTVRRFYSCIFCSDSPRYSIYNKRKHDKFNQKVHGGNFCSECLNVLEEITGTTFLYDYCS